MKIFALTLLSVLFFSCTNQAERNSPEPYLMHDVYLDLVDLLEQDVQEEIIQHLSGLAQIPGVLDLTVGTRLHTGDSRLDSTFDMALHMAFADVDALLAYQINEDHLAVKKAIAPYLASAPRVFDYRIQNYQLAGK